MTCYMYVLVAFQAFKLEHSDSGMLVHAGVLEFTSSSPTAGYLPRWMMEHLQALEGGLEGWH